MIYEQSQPRAGVAIGDVALELHELAKHGIFDDHPDTSTKLQEAFLEVGRNCS